MAVTIQTSRQTIMVQNFKPWFLILVFHSIANHHLSIRAFEGGIMELMVCYVPPPNSNSSFVSFLVSKLLRELCILDSLTLEA